MELILGWVLVILPGFLFLTQCLSSLNFPLAQKLGLQEAPEETDDLVQRAERYTAYWDVLTMVWLPVAGALIIADHALWPVMGLIGAAMYLDASGREAAKILSFRHEGVRVGPDKQHRIFFSTYVLMALLGLATMSLSLRQLLS